MDKKGRGSEWDDETLAVIEIYADHTEVFGPIAYEQYLENGPGVLVMDLEGVKKIEPGGSWPEIRYLHGKRLLEVDSFVPDDVREFLQTYDPETAFATLFILDPGRLFSMFFDAAGCPYGTPKAIYELRNLWPDVIGHTIRRA